MIVCTYIHICGGLTMTVGDRIKILRELFEISSNEFAEITVIHQVTISNYESN